MSKAKPAQNVERYGDSMRKGIKNYWATQNRHWGKNEVSEVRRFSCGLRTNWSDLIMLLAGKRVTSF